MTNSENPLSEPGYNLKMKDQWLSGGFDGRTVRREVKRRWLACGALCALLGAVVVPPRQRGGAPYLDWTANCARAYMYYSAGRECGVQPTRGVFTSVLLARAVAPGVAVLLAALEWTDHRVANGLVLTSLDGGCAWLSLAVSRDSATLSRVLATVACDYVAAKLAAPLATAFLCGGAALPAPGTFLLTSCGALLPWSLGAGLRRLRGPREGPVPRRACCVLLLCVQCHGAMEAAQGAMHPGELAAAAALVLAWLAVTAACCAAAARCGGALLQNVLPRGLERHDWVWSSTCAARGLGALPAALLAPLQALALSLALPAEPDDAEDLPH